MPNQRGMPVGQGLKPEFGWKLTPEQRDEMSRLYSDGASLGELSKKFGVTKANVIKVARARGYVRHK